MADRVFSIDFGSSFTKVCLRAAPGSPAKPVTLDSLRDELRMCVPSTVLVDTARGKAFCGPAAAERVPGPTLDVHQNWKRRVFAPPQPAAASGLDALLRSDDLTQLAARFAVPPGQLTHLANLTAAAAALAGGEPPPARVTPVGVIATTFFDWLFREVQKQCDRAGLPGPADTPAVLCVPALNTTADPKTASADLVRWAAKAGWQVSADGVLTEPYTNAVGVLTRGANHVQKNSRLHFAKMFDNGPLATVIKDSKYHPVYRAVVADVGSFTTDFAAVTLDTGGQTVDDPLSAVQVVGRSVPVGVSDLDARVLAGLSAESAKALGRLAQVGWDQFRETVYSEGKPILTAESGEVGGKADAPVVRGAIDWFAKQLHDATAEFCKGLPALGSNCLQELILTGGGCHIPPVREAVRDGVAAGGQTALKVFWPGRTTRQTVPPVQKIDDLLVRGGSAVGGASIYFDKAFW